jgi:hypothetical protein
MVEVLIKPCYVGPSHHSIVHPWVVDGGYGLQMWVVAVSILNKQLQTGDKEWFTSLGLGKGPTAPHHKKPACYKMTRSLYSNRT